MELEQRQKVLVNRALRAAALESGAKELKDAAKDAALEALGVDSGKFATSEGVIQSQTRTELDWNLEELQKLVEGGTLPLTLLLQHVKAQASLKTVLGESLTEKVTYKRPLTYWILKPSEQCKAHAAAKLEDI
jgi:hypothetical protein